MKWSNFFETKNGMVDHVCHQFQKWKDAEMPVKIVRCDNPGENKIIESWNNNAKSKLSLDFEYTARYTAQKDILAEVRFLTIEN